MTIYASLMIGTPTRVIFQK